MKKQFLGFLAVFLLSLSAFASLTISKMDMENHLRERVQAIATKADPTAFAQVQIKLKRIRSNLSFLGMQTDVTPLENGQGIGPGSIESIEVKIHSKLEPFPEWLQKEIKSTIEIEDVKVNVVYSKPETPIRDVTAQISEFFTQDLHQAFTGSLGSIKWGMIGLGVMLSLGFVGLAWSVMSFSKKLEDVLQRVIAENLVPMATALGQMAGTGGGAGAKAVPVAKEKSDRDDGPRVMSASSDSKSQFEQYPVETLGALFVDCYWTHSDGYAHYLWSQLNPKLREALMKSEIVDAGYFSYIIGVSPRPEDYHSHAWYMNPHSKFNKVDQKALSGWLKQNLDASHMVSPIRLDKVELSLEERLKIAASTKKAVVEVKLAASAPRVLAQKLKISKLSEADELFLFKNHAQVHYESRAQLKSLVWLAVAPLEQRKKILDQMDARQLADAWSAPKPVLEELKKGIPAKKLEMLEHFLKTNEASRDNDVFAYLVDSGLQASKAEPVLKAA